MTIAGWITMGLCWSVVIGLCLTLIIKTLYGNKQTPEVKCQEMDAKCAAKS